MRYWQNDETGKVLAMEDQPQWDSWFEIEQWEYEQQSHPLSRPTQDAQDGAKRPLTGRNGKPTNVLADGTVVPIAPPVI